MASYDVFKDANGRRYAVKAGYNFFAFFFSYIWALFSKLWVIAIVLMILSAALNKLFNYSIHQYHAMDNSIYLYIAFIILGAIFYIMYNIGKHGNKWLKDDMLKRGYEHLGNIEAQSKNEAIEKFRGVISE
jgi:hypothetical protein